ncbi:hypothetical protein E1B28_002749 [Marasmius oreades]|uniref:Protein kinase domain-containing protein n=1 Tax=Marasmius oreades TaxID=181124 RepID=A0A9P7RP91_9AGAR|nr:uncharacterized protein E1B28_002749 [Marasmius oreades]KAG7086828.1 hypothetical protein E1B28_002749 [Marasmius oreades]
MDHFRSRNYCFRTAHFRFSRRVRFNTGEGSRPSRCPQVVRTLRSVFRTKRLQFLASPPVCRRRDDRPSPRETDHGTEAWVLQVALSIVSTMLRILQLQILGEWGLENDSDEAKEALQLLRRFSVHWQYANKGSMPDITITFGTKDHPTKRAATIATKGTSIVNYRFSSDSESFTHDSYIQSLIESQVNVSSQYDSKTPYSWKNDALQLLAQMTGQARSSDTGLCFSTSIYGFTRIGYAIPNDVMLISQNLSERDSLESRQVPGTYLPFLCHLHRFVLSAMMKIAPTILAPGSQLANFSIIPQNNSTSMPACTEPLLRGAELVSSLLQSANMNISMYLMWTTPGILKYVSAFTATEFRGEFRNFSPSVFRLPQLQLQFPRPKIRKFTAISINYETRLVLKEFRNEEKFTRELSAYNIFDRSKFPHVPKFYGAFYNTWRRTRCILMEYIGDRLGFGGEGELLNDQEWDELKICIMALHELGVHHHDLAFENIARTQDGKLRLVDLGYASIGDDDCPGSRCQDFDWL